MRSRANGKAKKESRPVRVYSFGLLPPVSNAEKVIEQLRLVNRYRNGLTEIEREARDQKRGLDSSSLEGSKEMLAFLAASERLQELLCLAKRQNAADRSRSGSRELRQLIKEARAEEKAARRDLTAARKVARERTKDAWAAIDSDKIAKGKVLNAKFGSEATDGEAIHWGTRQLADMAAFASSKMPLYDFDEPNNPSFRRFDGSGSVGVQIQKKQRKSGKVEMSTSDICLENNLLRIDSEPSWFKLNRHGQPRRKLKLLHMCIGRAEDGEPIFASWPIIMHRELPAGGIIKRASVTRRRVGNRFEWAAQIYVDKSNCDRPRPCDGPAVAVHLGWALERDGGLRVASFMSQTGETGELVLPARLVGAFLEKDKLLSTRKQNANAARELLEEWLAANDVPPWLQEETETISLWESPSRLARLASRWARNRFDGDEGGFTPLESWRYNDHHLWAWQSSNGPYRARREIFRLFAHELSKKFGGLIVDNTVYSDIAKRPKAEEDGESKKARRLRGIAACGELRLTVAQAFQKVMKVSSDGLSMTCPECGSRHSSQKDTKSRFMACVSCSYHRDIDTTALLNALARAGYEDDVKQIIARGHEASRALRGGFQERIGA